MTLEAWIDTVGDRVLAALDDVELDLRPRRVTVGMTTNAFDEDAWRILIFLPAPTQETWDRDAVFDLRRAAVDALDAIAIDQGRALPGQTVAFVTTDEASLDDIAADDAPEPGEDPVRDA